jgi:O-antigen/teichoic acid export membrane protein
MAPVEGRDPEPIVPAGEYEDSVSLLRYWRRRLASARIINQLSWVTGSYILILALRFPSNIILSRLLAPQIFGIMMVVNTLRTGVELLSDIGIGQNIVSNADGDKPAFYNTAWTMQIIRGVALGLLGLIVAGPLSHLYPDPTLAAVLPFISILFILTGLQSPAHFLLQKQGNVKLYSIFEVCLAITAFSVTVVLAIITPTVWALLGGLILTTVASTVLSFFLIYPSPFRFCFDKGYAKQIYHFGKWVFASSIVFFLGMNFDRLYLPTAAPLAIIGIYGVAKTFSDAASMLVQRVSGLLLFPKIAASRQVGAELRRTIARPRAIALGLSIAGLSCAIAGSDRLITALYDPRYHAAAFILPILLIGIWFGILAAIGESILLGTGQPARTAGANGAKFVWTAAGLPLAMPHYGMAGAVVLITAGDFVRYLVLAALQRGQGVSFFRQDVTLTLALVFATALWRALFHLVGLVPSLAQWSEYSALLHY